MRACAAGDRRAPRCRHGQCPRCRRAHVGRRTDDALRIFPQLGTDRVFWVSVLVAAEPELFEPRVVTNLLDPLGLRLPMTHEIARVTRRLVADARERVDGAIGSMKPVMFAAEGAFEFGVIDPHTCGPQKARFLQDIGIKTGWDADPDVADVADLALLHLHFVCAVKRRRGYATRREIMRVLKSEFPGRRRVFVKGLDARRAMASNVRRLVGYSLKSFSDFRPERAAEIALVLNAMGVRSMSFVRRIGMGQAPSGGSTGKASDLGIGDRHPSSRRP
jgi:hypothetical protein